MLLMNLQNLRHVQVRNMFSIMECVHNDLNLDVTNIRIESMRTIESDKYDRVRGA